ncbi:14540_t:CDS:2 [Cetraspora pellucida]|uniref:14540_t:CDS:1 n=1 Tax=Cetraspora pellucida TaxID=1433469 RepID=A0A9N8ZX81_9GLOM|nr:14540_t:CDS:2 [Cetraspora pellucida]
MVLLVEALCKSRTFFTLYIGDNRLGLLGSRALAEIFQKNTALTTRKLYRVETSINDGIILVEDVLQNKTLASLDFNNKLQKESTDALSKNPTLASFNLINTEGVVALENSLYNNTTLTSLNIN